MEEFGDKKKAHKKKTKYCDAHNVGQLENNGKQFTTQDLSVISKRMDCIYYIFCEQFATLI